MVNKYGLMEPSMRGCGGEEKLMVREKFGTQMVKCLMANGKMIKLMGLEFILI
jgi:hypothetical protein